MERSVPKQRSFHLSVSSPTNDYGPDFLAVELGRDDVLRIVALAGAVRSLGVYSVSAWDGRPDWYRGCPEEVAEELAAAGADVDRMALIDDEVEEARVEVCLMVVTEDDVYWESESAGGDLYSSEPIPIDELARRVGAGRAA
jgi:hypothetical protein